MHLYLLNYTANKVRTGIPMSQNNNPERMPCCLRGAGRADQKFTSPTAKDSSNAERFTKKLHNSTIEHGSMLQSASYRGGKGQRNRTTPPMLKHSSKNSTAPQKVGVCCKCPWYRGREAKGTNKGAVGWADWTLFISTLHASFHRDGFVKAENGENSSPVGGTGNVLVLLIRRECNDVFLIINSPVSLYATSTRNHAFLLAYWMDPKYQL